MENNMHNYKALIEQNKVLKTIPEKSLVPFGRPDSKTVSKYAPGAILIEDLAKQLKNAAIPPASEIQYDSTTSGLTATDVQSAIDEIVASLPQNTEIDIITAEILAGHTTPISVLSEVSSQNQYYLDYILAFEYTAGDTDFDPAGAGMRYPQLSYTSGGEQTVLELAGLSMVGNFTTSTTKVQVVKMSDVVTAIGSLDGAQDIVNTFGLNFSTNLAIINGNGSVKVKVFAVVETIG